MDPELDIPISTWCAGQATDGRRCWRRVVAVMAIIPVCEQHRRSLALEAHHQFWDNHPLKNPASIRPTRVPEIVYYVTNRPAGEIKIGTTTKLRERVRSLRNARPGVLLAATEPGGHGIEMARHKRFAEYRIDGGKEREWFRATSDLDGWIAEVREEHGILQSTYGHAIPPAWVEEPVGA